MNRRNFLWNFGGTLAVIVSFGGCGIDIETFPSAAHCFEATFGIWPPASVSDLVGEGRAFRDSGHVYMRFKANQGQLLSLIGPSFKPIAAAGFPADGSVGPVPDWWTPLAGNPTLILHSSAFHPTFTRGEAYVSYDSSTNTAYMYWDGID